MSQSPQRSAAESLSTDVRAYRDAWSALSHLIGSGRSFSGNERNCFFLNTRDGAFSEASAAFGVDLNDDSRAVAVTDWNFDGAPDIWLTNRTAPRVKLLLNRGSTNHWMRIRLEGAKSNRDAIGARVTVVTTEPRLTLSRTVRAGDAFLAQSSKWLHFGLADSEVDQVRIRWPSGLRQQLAGLSTGAHYTIREGEEPRRWSPPNIDLEESQKTKSPTVESNTRTWIMGRVPLVEPHYQTPTGIASADDFLGKPLLINLWSKTCQPCWHELVEWSKAKEAFQAAGCQVLALSVDPLGGQSAASLEPIQWPFAHGDATEQFIDGLEALQRTFLEWQQPLPVPSSFLLDSSGCVAAIYKGTLDSKVLLQDVELLTASPHDQRDAAVPFQGRWASEVFPRDPTSIVRTLEMQQSGQAWSYLRRYVELNLTSVAEEARAVLLLVDRLLVAKQFEQLAAVLDRLRSRADTPDRLHRDIAYRLLKHGRAQDALPHFDLVIAHTPNDAVLHYNAGIAALQSRQPERAIELLQRAATLDPKDGLVQYHLGNAHRFLKDDRSAVRHYRQAHALKPTWDLAANNLAWLLATSQDDSLRDGQAALRAIQPFCRDWTSSSVDSALLGTYVAALAEVGDFVTALKVNAHLIALQQSESNDQQLRKLLTREQQLRGEQPIRD